MNKLTLKDLPVSGRRILMRVDFNVPLNKEGIISDDFRIQSALPSIRYVLENKGKLILLSHLGRPQGERNLEYSLAPCAKRLSEILERPVPLAHDCIGHCAKHLASSLEEGEVLLLENLRFHKAEEDPSLNSSFADELAQLGDAYVNDAFASAHRNHTSITKLPLRFPKDAAAGLLLEKEIDALTPLRQNPPRPFYLILGGAKVSSKIGLIEGLLSHLDGIFIGGAMAFPFLKAQGYGIGSSLCSEEDLALAKKILEKKSVKIFLPSDFIAVQNTSSSPQPFAVGKIPEEVEGKDIGPLTIETWKEALASAAMVFWNGPLGVFETAPFDIGSCEIAEFLVKERIQLVVGGGDSSFCIREMGFSNCVAHLSTGGGSTLAFLELGHLAGIDALSDK